MRAAFPLLCVLASSASAQVPEASLELPASRLHRATSPPREAGVYHLATGAWTRKASSALLGADVIYDNTCSTGFFSPLSGDRYIDEGRLPSPSTPTDFSSRPGCASTYVIDGFQLRYCTDRASLGTYTVAFFESYIACATVIGVAPTASFALTQLPGSASGSLTCWTVTIDLEAPPQQSSLAFAMLAEGDGVYTPPFTNDLFGWSMECSLPDLEQSSTGVWIAGDPNTCSRYDGTRWDVGPVPPAWPNNLAEEGTGMGTLAQFRVENGPTTPGCYFFQANPYESFYLELYADACDAPSGLAFCAGDGSGTACPCGNASAVGANEGCLNSLGIGAKLTTIGTASLSNDSLVLVGSRMPASSSALYFQGTSRVNGGAGSTFGDGLRCAGGSVQRLGTTTNTSVGSFFPSGNQLDVSVLGQVLAPGVRTYQVWYRNSAAFCTSATFNLSNGWELAWVP